MADYFFWFHRCNVLHSLTFVIWAFPRYSKVLQTHKREYRCEISQIYFSIFFLLIFRSLSLRFSLYTLALISLLLHLTGDWTPPGVQSKFHTWSGLGNQLENPSSIFTPRLRSISSLSSGSHPLLTRTSSFLSWYLFFFFLSIIFSFSLFMFAHMYERSTLCRPVNVDTSTSSLPALNIHSAVHPFITLSYFSLHAQTGIHLNNSDLFISFCRCCRKYFHSVTSVVLKLWVHASSLVCVLLFCYSFLLLLRPAGINKVSILSFHTITAPALVLTPTSPPLPSLF